MTFRELFELLRTAHDDAVLVVGEEAAGSLEITYKTGISGIYSIDNIEVMKKFWPNEDGNDEVEIWIRGQ